MTTESGQTGQLLIEGVKERNLVVVKRALESDENGARSLKIQDCFDALFWAFYSSEEEIAHLILDYAEKAFAKEAFSGRINETLRRIFNVDRASVPIFKTLIDRKVPMYDSNLVKAFEEGDAAVTAILIDAGGCSPQSVLCCDFQHFSKCWLTEKHKKVWKLLLPHWTSDDVLQSRLFISALMFQEGGHMLQLLGKLGMNFLYCLSRDDETATKLMQRALEHSDPSTVQFLLDRGFDVNAYFDTEPLLHYLLDVYRKYPSETHDILLRVIQQSSCHLKNVLDNKRSFSGATKNVPVDDSLLETALNTGHAEIARALIAAGCCPRKVLQLHGLALIFAGNFDERGSYEDVCKVLIPHVTAEEFLQPKPYKFIIDIEPELNVLQLLADLGMEFVPYISSCDSNVVRCMQLALKKERIRIVRFLINHKFDTNTYIDSYPLHVLNSLSRFWERRDCQQCVHNAIVKALTTGADPSLRDSYNRDFIDVCIYYYYYSSKYMYRYVPIHVGYYVNYKFLKFSCGLVLKLITRIGFRVPSGKFNSNETKDDELLKSVSAENSLAPSLQSLCRLEIRLAKGCRTAEFVDQLKYPQKLKDFILLKDIDLEEFKIDDVPSEF